jgi:hypothetical protein
MFGVLVDDHDTTAGTDDTAHFRYSFLDINRVLERFSRIRGIKRGVGEGKRRHRAAARSDIFRNHSQHSFREIEGYDASRGIIVFQNSREPTLAGAYIERAAAIKVTKVPHDELHVKNAGINGRREMLLVRRGLIEAAADLVERGAGSRLTEPV